GRLGPGAGDAHEAAGLVLPHQGAEDRRAVEFRAQNAGHAPQRTPTTRRTVVMEGLVVLGLVHGFALDLEVPLFPECPMPTPVPWRPLIAAGHGSTAAGGTLTTGSTSVRC